MAPFPDRTAVVDIQTHVSKKREFALIFQLKTLWFDNLAVLDLETFADFMKWYNTAQYHESLDQKHFIQTPENAFWATLPEGRKLNIFLRRMEVELNVYGRI